MINRYILYLSGEPYIHWLLVALIALAALIVPGVTRSTYYLIKPVIRALAHFIRRFI